MLLPNKSLEVIKAFEASMMPLTGIDQPRIEGIPAWSLKRHFRYCTTDNLFCLQTVGYSGVYLADCGDDTELVELENDDDPTLCRYRCPETLRWKSIPRQHTAVLQINERCFRQKVAGLLDIPLDALHEHDTPVLPGFLWRLGQATLDHDFYPHVWLARGLQHEWPAMLQRLQQTRSPTLILSSSAIPEYVQWPSNVTVVSLADAVMKHRSDTVLDKAWLSQMMMGERAAISPTLPVTYDHHHQVLTIVGKPPWAIKGQCQARAIAYLFAQARQQRWAVSAAELLAAAQTRSRTVSALFDGNTEWRNFLHSPRRGYYAFRLH